MPGGLSRRALLPVLLLFPVACAHRPSAPKAADGAWLLYNARVYDATRTAPEPAAVAVRDGRIVFVGPEPEARRMAGRGAQAFDARGGLVLPGFGDAHVHPLEGGLELGGCVLSGLDEAQALLTRVADCDRASPGTSWLRGSGWELPAFPDGHPRKGPLDAVLPHRPAFLLAADGHSAWVNSRALALAGLDRDTPDPPMGRIERDESGEPTGTLREAAVELAGALLPAYSSAERMAAIERSISLANAAGLTALREASTDEEGLAAYEALARQGRLNARVRLTLRLDPEDGDPDLDRLESLRARVRAAGLELDAVKLFLDGVVESRTAFLLEPYRGTDARGESDWDAGLLGRTVRALEARGWTVHAHAVGDGAVRRALDAFEAAGPAPGPGRRQLAHLQLVAPEDLARFARLGVTAVVQPLWGWRDPYVSELAEPVLGPERSARLYPSGALARAGAPLAGGSDWSVSSIAPLQALETAVTRREAGSGPGDPWLPEQALTLKQALDAYTLGSARALQLEGLGGTLEPGKAADLVVLDRDIFSGPPHDIAGARVRLTLLEGRAVHPPSMEGRDAR